MTTDKAAAPVGAVPQGDDGSLRERIELSLQCNQPETEVEYAWSSLLRQAAAALASQAARMGEDTARLDWLNDADNAMDAGIYGIPTRWATGDSLRNRIDKLRGEAG